MNATRPASPWAAGTWPAVAGGPLRLVGRPAATGPGLPDPSPACSTAGTHGRSPWRWALLLGCSSRCCRVAVALGGRPGSRPALRLLLAVPLTVTGRVPADTGRFVATANHASLIDGLLLVLCLPGPVCFVAGEKFATQRVAGRSCAGSAANSSTGPNRNGRPPTPAASPTPCATDAASRSGPKGRWTAPQGCGYST